MRENIVSVAGVLLGTALILLGVHWVIGSLVAAAVYAIWHWGVEPRLPQPAVRKKPSSPDMRYVRN